MSKKAKIIVSVATVAVITGGTFTYYKAEKNKAEENHKIEIKFLDMKEQEKSVEDRVGKLVLGDQAKEYENLLNEYNASIENKDFNKAEDINKKINDFITNLEKSNLSELDTKIEDFRMLDVSKLDDDTKNDIETKLTLIENLKANKDFKSAFQEIDGLTDNTNNLIEAKAEEEKKQQEEAQNKETNNEESNNEENKNNSSNAKENNNQNSNEASSNNDATNSSSGGSSSPSKVRSHNPYENGSVESFIAQSPTAQYTDQIIGVVASGSSAQVYLLEKNNGVWQTVLQTSGIVGSQGVGQASESVSRTPKGSYSLGFAFGTGGNPGTNLAYRQITNDSYWISDVNSPYYNTWQEGDFGGNGNEHLADQSIPYRYAITLNYDAGVGGGSAFFLHCSNGIPTAGCISVPTDVMLTFMQRIHSGAHIINVNSLSELANY